MPVAHNMDLNSRSTIGLNFHSVNRKNRYDGGMSWNHRLKAIMDERGMRPPELSRRADITYDSVTKYLKGAVTNPRGDVIDKLAAALGVSASFLRYGEVDPTGAPTLQIPASPVSPQPAQTDIRRRLMDMAWDAAARIDEDVFEGRCMPREKAQVFAIVLEYLEGALGEFTEPGKTSGE